MLKAELCKFGGEKEEKRRKDGLETRKGRVKGNTLETKRRNGKKKQMENDFGHFTHEG